MKKTNKIIKMFFLLIIVSLTMVNISNAVEYGANMKLNVNKTSVQVNDTITLTLALQSVTNTNGVSTVHAKIEYDKDVLEYVSCEAVDSWSAPVYNSETQEFVTERADVMEPTGDIIKIIFKVISEPSDEKTTVSITEFDVADTENEITVDEVSVDLTIEKKETESNKPNQDDSETTQKPNEDNNNGNQDIDKEENNLNSNTNINNKNDNTTQTGTIPQTGEELILPVTIAIFAIVACIFAIKYKKMKEIK